MLRLDYRAGSGELKDLFKPYGVRVTRAKLDFGDFDWLGRGPTGECGVVVERKRMDDGDFIASMQSRRLSGHQLPGMAASYDYAYLIVEGIWRPGPDGELQIQRWGKWVSQGVHARAINNYLMGLCLRAGVIVWRTANKEETVAFIVDQYRMWTEKDWEKHTSHDQVYTSTNMSAGIKLTLKPRTIAPVEIVAMQLPGVDRKARAVAKYFRNVDDMVNANLNDWTKIPGIGKEGARKIIAWLHGGEGNAR